MMWRAPLCVALAILVVAGCRRDMAQQSKLGADAPSRIWADGTSSRPLPDGVVAQGDLARDQDATQPPQVTSAFLLRGQERYQVFCTPCHGLAGEGDGMIVQRGFPRPPSYLSARLRAAPAQHFFDVISQGYGVMYAYAARVPPRDRWAIVAYIRALQVAGSPPAASP